jgi:hypothetical protein
MERHWAVRYDSFDDAAELQLATREELIMAPQPPPPLTVPDDLETEMPAQVSLKFYPSRRFYGS